MRIVRDAREVGTYALVAAILCGCTQEDAFDYIEEGIEPRIKHKMKYNEKDDIIDIIILKIREGKTYEDIAEIYNISTYSVYGKIRRMRDRKDTRDMVALREAGLYYREIAEFYKDITPQGIQRRITRYKEEIENGD